MVQKQHFVVGDREFNGYKLGWVETLDHAGTKRRLQAYFVTEDDEYDEKFMLVVDENDGDERDWFDEYEFLSYYGLALAYPLVGATAFNTRVFRGFPCKKRPFGVIITPASTERTITPANIVRTPESPLMAQFSANNCYL